MTGDLAAVPLRDEIHVWTAQLDSGPAGRLAAFEVLSPEELDRAGRYRFEHDRRRFIVARAALRYLLAGYLGRDPGSLRLVSGPRGKPQLAPGVTGWLRFNSSRSESLAVFAVGRDRELGVDVERVRTDMDFEPLVDRVLSEAERGALDQLAPEARRRAFYRCWTRKEAYLKALGVGLAVAPHELDVTGDHVKPLIRGQLRGLLEPDSTWSLHDVDLCPGYVAALAVEDDLLGPPEIRGSILRVPDCRTGSVPNRGDIRENRGWPYGLVKGDYQLCVRT
jgi:4'-phosphopantetheinyl transferase